ncbi:hypothetical protein HF521_016987 [Silurus meridionalis]|uniref:Little elongation complex subunit 1 C-terminal domain-containing protein n=1 Tax=Silurus meridionalis TaxID=175797 RepID=A0A8T0BRH8_SILME|nr:hypothetical protein HF521_016987 [Silurus meridionalis]
MTSRKQLRSKIGDKDDEASSVATPAEDTPTLPPDLERLRTALLSDTAQIVHSLLKTELTDALSPVNATLEQVKSYYEAHDQRLREVEESLNVYSDRMEPPGNIYNMITSTLKSFLENSWYGYDLCPATWNYIFSLDLLCAQLGWTWTITNIIRCLIQCGRGADIEL